ncbi:MAG: DNA-directed RNA polymerase subunit omega [Defluviitaleaceae bacterium]|nr:DNA-directed RNA polymerase subunit omega [Defluviitaleaceae bacterium]
MNLLNDVNETEDNEITSRYTIVMAIAKRARQIIDGQEALAKADTDKAVSLAVAEMSAGKLKVSAARASDEELINRNEFISVIEADNLDEY